MADTHRHVAENCKGKAAVGPSRTTVDDVLTEGGSRARGTGARESRSGGEGSGDRRAVTIFKLRIYIWVSVVGGLPTSNTSGKN